MIRSDFMPSQNPKHRKKITQTKPMGIKSAKETCYVSGCTLEATHHIAQSNLEGYLSKLNWKLKTNNKKTRKVGLCKKHHKLYKKLKDKDEKFSKDRDFGPKKPPKREKSHNYME